MKKRLISVCCSLILVIGMITFINTDIEASADTPLVDGSHLTNDIESIGYASPLTRGVDLLNGYSKIVRLGPGAIYAGGTTMAAHTVDKVKIAVMVERVAKEGEAWDFVDGWQAEDSNTIRISANRQLLVDGNYYYRVRCIHSAANDVSSSFTDGIFIEEP